jgi:hypothetical protein
MKPVIAIIERRLVRKRSGKLSTEDQRNLHSAIEQIIGFGFASTVTSVFLLRTIGKADDIQHLIAVECKRAAVWRHDKVRALSQEMMYLGPAFDGDEGGIYLFVAQVHGSNPNV